VVSFSPPKSRIVAGILALLIGGLGVHKFYLGKIGLGVLYLVFFWTFVPAIIAFIEGIIYLVQSDEEFARNQGVNVRPS
jgi:TM2 domain-containing membrane protein YozV